MQSLNRALILLILFTSSITAFANNSPQPFNVGSMKKLKLEAKEQPILVAFWATDCAYCFEELDFLLQWKKQNPQVKIALVSTDPPANQALVIDMLKKHGYQPDTTYQFADSYIEKIRYDIDKRWMGELPRTYFMYGKQMKATSGAVTQKQLQEWLLIKK